MNIFRSSQQSQHHPPAQHPNGLLHLERQAGTAHDSLRRGNGSRASTDDGDTGTIDASEATSRTSQGGDGIDGEVVVFRGVSRSQ